jgi:8-oxo-dGTP pyrophosphatase MutT (NUDIX family)
MNLFKAIGTRILNILRPIVDRPNKVQYSDCIIYNPKGQVLLLQRTYTDDFMNGKWGLPGGHVDPGEDPTVAAAREVLEETGLIVVPVLIDIKVKEDCIIYYYEATLNSDLFDPNNIVLDVDEHRGWEWVNPSDISDYELILDLGTYLPSYLKLQPLSQDIVTLDSSWLTLQDAFNNDLITEEQFLKAREQYLKLKKAEALSIIAKGFDEGLVSEEDYLKVVEKYGKY